MRTKRGPALYVAGDFAIAGEVRADSIARFDGVTSHTANARAATTAACAAACPTYPCS